MKNITLIKITQSNKTFEVFQRKPSQKGILELIKDYNGKEKLSSNALNGDNIIVEGQEYRCYHQCPEERIYESQQTDKPQPLNAKIYYFKI